MKTQTTLTFKILCAVLLTASLVYCFWYPFAYAINSSKISGIDSTQSGPLMESTIYFLIFALSAAGFGIAFFILFIKLIRSFSSSLIFDKTNSRRLLWMGICMIGIGVCQTAMVISQVLTAKAEVLLDGYEITYPALDLKCILFGLGILVMNEILRLATSIKEDQDLTI